MIECFEGKIGGGKTYSAVERILKHVAGGGAVFTNVDLLPKEIVKYCAYRWFVRVEPEEQIFFLKPEEIKRFDLSVKMGTYEKPVLLVVDEAHIFFNARRWKDAAEELLFWLTQSRKWHVDVIFITQSAETLDKQFRLQAQDFWQFRDMDRVHVPIVGTWPFSQILEKRYDHEDKKVQQWRFKKKDPRVFKTYQSFAFLDAKSREIAERERENAIKKRQLVKLTLWECVKVRLGLRVASLEKLWEGQA